MVYDNTNKGVLFNNNRKEMEKQPDYNGSLNVEGKEYWLSGWKKEGKKCTFISLAITLKEDNFKKEYKQEVKQEQGEEIPF